MRGQEETYERLRNLAKYGDFEKRYEIENLVNLLMKDIVDPLNQRLRMVLGKREFDGEVILGKGRAILYEIHAGNLSRFRYDSLLSLARNTYFPRRRTYLLTIARSFSDLDRARIMKMGEQVLTKKVKLCFMDYETLISLHKFNSKEKIEHREKDAKTMKRLFLLLLFESDSIIVESLFGKALSSAENRYHFEIQEPEVLYEPQPVTVRPRLDEQRLRNIEDLLERLLIEIRALQKELHKD